MSLSFYDVTVGFKTSNGNTGEFNPWNREALRYLDVEIGALDPHRASFNVQGDLYQVPSIARRGHECGGSVNVQGIEIGSGETVEFSHIFYIDTTGHGRGSTTHWNHELWIRKDDGQWEQFDKRKTAFHIIQDSNWIEIWLKDLNRVIESKKVTKEYREDG